MPRKNLIRTSLYHYHITTRSNHREWFSIPLDEVWPIAIEAFKKAQKETPAQVFQFVLMANHYHLLIKTPDRNIDKFMYWFNKTFSEQLRSKSGKINRMFGGSYKWSLIHEPIYLDRVIKYIYQNPLRAGLVTKCQDYPFSTLYFLARELDSPIEIQTETQFSSDFHPINLTLSYEEVDQIRSGLRKTRFKPRSSRSY